MITTATPRTPQSPQSPRRFPPAPPEFRTEFERGGWERVELLYGARTAVIRKWIHQTGAQTRRALRAAGSMAPVAA